MPDAIARQARLPRTVIFVLGRGGKREQQDVIILLGSGRMPRQPGILLAIVDRLVEAHLGAVAKRTAQGLGQAALRLAAGAIGVRRDACAGRGAAGIAQQASNVEILAAGDRERRARHGFAACPRPSINRGRITSAKTVAVYSRIHGPALTPPVAGPVQRIAAMPSVDGIATPVIALAGPSIVVSKAWTAPGPRKVLSQPARYSITRARR